ncbi:MAG: hypothetical protein K2Q10_00675 [Rhodospirillales bacterium]|nr:hypothetical protein [Rhodospirillales bacterium]
MPSGAATAGELTQEEIDTLIGCRRQPPVTAEIAKASAAVGSYICKQIVNCGGEETRRCELFGPGSDAFHLALLLERYDGGPLNPIVPELAERIDLVCRTCCTCGTCWARLLSPYLATEINTMTEYDRQPKNQDEV